MTNSKEFVKNAIKYCIPSVVSACVGILIIPIISRIFPADEYGKINMFYSVGNMLLYIVLLGLDSAYIRFYYEPPTGVKRQQIFSLAIWTSAIIDVLMYVVAVVIFPSKVGKYLFGEKNNILILFLGVYVLGLVIFRLLTTESRMEKKAGLYNTQQIVLMITSRISYVAVAFFSTNYEVAIASITVSTVLFALIFLKKQKEIKDFSFPGIESSKLLEIFKFSVPFMPTALMVWLNNSLAKMILTGYGDFNSVGVLTIATSVANIFSIIPQAFCVYWSPFIYSNYKKEHTFIKKTHNYIFLISILMLIGICLFQDILYWFVGTEYKSSQPYFMLVMLTPIQTLLCETTSYGIILSNNTKYNLWISAIAVFVNMITGYSFYRHLGVLGVALGIALSAVFQLVAKTLIGQKYYKSIVSWKTTISGTVLIILLSVGNIIFYKNIVLRNIVLCTSCILSYFIYKKDINEILSKIYIQINRLRR